MAVNRGAQTYFGITKEGTRLTAETTGATWLPWKAKSIERMQEYLDNDSAIGVLDEIVKRDLEHEYVEGSGEFKLDEINAGLLFKYFFGTVNTTGANPYTHVYSVPTNVEIDTFTAFYNLPNVNDLKANGCIINNIQISAEAGGESMITVAFQGLSEQSASSQTDTYTQPVILQSLHSSFGYADNIAGLSSPTLVDTQNINITLNNNAELDKALGNLNPVNNYVGRYSYEITATLLLKASALETFKANATKKAYQIKFEDTTRDLGGGVRPTIKFEIPPSAIELSRTTNLSDLVAVDVTIKPEYSFSDTFSLRTTVINATASY